MSWVKSAWPTSRIFWLANPEWTPLLKGNPDLESVITFPRREFRGWQGPLNFYRWQRRFIWRSKPDLVLDYQGLLRSALVGKLAAPKAFYGLADAREGASWLYDQAVSIPANAVHAVERYLSLTQYAIQRCGSDTLPLPRPLRFHIPVGEMLNADAAANLRHDYVLLHPFSRGAAKSLTVVQVEEFCRQLAPRQVVLVGRRPDTLGGLATIGVDLLGRTTLGQLITLVRGAAFIISVDSGPAHLAAALDRPLVAIHTWSDPRRVGPYREDAWIWKNGELLQMRDLPLKPPAFFRSLPSAPTAVQIEEICAIAISS